jgi:hypothetical protein
MSGLDQSDSVKKAPGGPYLFWLMSLFLIGTFLWDLSTPAHEYDSETVVIMEMLFEFGMLVGLLGMIKTRGSNPVLWIAMLAGVGLFAIRLSSDSGWWTGHAQYSLIPRCYEVANRSPCEPP